MVFCSTGAQHAYLPCGFGTRFHSSLNNQLNWLLCLMCITPTMLFGRPLLLIAAVAQQSTNVVQHSSDVKCR
jgi:hypothetical protein